MFDHIESNGDWGQWGNVTFFTGGGAKRIFPTGIFHLILPTKRATERFQIRNVNTRDSLVAIFNWCANARR